MESKKILLVLQNDLMGGAEQLLKSVSKTYASQGHNVDVIIVRSPMQKNWDSLKNNINIKYLNSNSYLTGFIYLFFYMILKKKKYDYMISSNININSILGLVNNLKLLKTKKLIIRETTSVFLRNKGLKKQIQVLKYILGYSGSDLIICQSDIMKTQFIDNLHQSKSWNLVTMQNPIDSESIIEKSKENIEKELQNKYIITAGRLITEKGYDILIKVFNEIKDNIEHNLIILGEGKLKDDLQVLINKLNLTERVFLYGFEKNPFPYFKNADLCVVSSRYEGFPNVLLQMALLNDNVVSTNCAGNIDKIPGVYIAETNNVQSLKTEILKCLENKIDYNLNKLKLNYLNSLTYEKYVFNIEENL